MDQLIELHRRACEGFSWVVDQSGGRWRQPSPCTQWDAAGVVEHVIGFHDVLLLRPLNAKPKRPKEDHAKRWRVTVPAIFSALSNADRQSLSRGPGSSPMDLGRLLPMLSTDVAVHTWDLARAVGVEPRLDEELCRTSYEAVRANKERVRISGMFAPPMPVADDADIVTKLVAFLGRDPTWGC